MNDSLYKKYESKRGVVEKIISKYNASTLMKLDEILDQRIKMVKLSRIAVEMQKERITKYSFIKSVINTQLSAK